MSPAAVDPNNFYTDYAPFAAGRTVLVQYGYGNYVPASSYDQDYACQ
jgi:hypothetical protein